MITDIPCIIFAGGKSSRMGADKSLLPFGDEKTLTEYQYKRLNKIFSEVYISCKDKSKFDFEAEYIEDAKTTDVFAPTAGFVASYKRLKSECFFVIAVDTPFINKDVMQAIIAQDRQNCDATIAKNSGKMQPLCGLYHRSLEAKFLKMQSNNEHKLGKLLENAATCYVDFNDKASFANLNTKEEYLKATSHILS